MLCLRLGVVMPLPLTLWTRPLPSSLALSKWKGMILTWFPLGCSAREHFLKLLGCVMDDIEHNFVDTIYAERHLKWRAAVLELIHVVFEMGFLLEHLREIARVFFMRKV